MDEAKKKYLEELKKQVDPQILSKMADYLGSGDQGAGGGIDVGPPGPSSGSPADLIRERRAMQFQERVARRKRESQSDDTPQQSKEQLLAQKYNVLIFSSTEIWTRIIESQFKVLGFGGSMIFAEFDGLIRHIMEGLREGTLKDFVVAVAMKEIRHFLLSWGKIREGLEGHTKKTVLDNLDNIIYFLVVESPRQVQDQLAKIIGEDRILCLTDDLAVNKEKTEDVLALVEHKDEVKEPDNEERTRS